MLFNPFIIIGLGLVSKSVVEIVFLTCGLSQVIRCVGFVVVVKFFDYTIGQYWCLHFDILPDLSILGGCPSFLPSFVLRP